MALSIAFAAGYTVLLIVTLGRRSRRASGGWVIGYLASCVFLSVVYGLSFLPGGVGGTLQAGSLSVLFSLLSISLLGAVTFEYLNRPRAWVWPALGGAALLAVIVGQQYEPAPGLLGQAWLPSLLSPSPSIVGLMAAFFWLSAAVAQLVFTLIALRQARLPLHANRILYWALWLPVVIIGGTTMAWGEGPLSSIGQGLQFVGAGALVHAVLTPRLIDIRNSARRAVGHATLLLVAALVTLVAIELAAVILAPLSGVDHWVGAAGVALGVAVIYQLLRGLTEQFVTQLVLRAGYDTGQITRAFSERAANLLDVQELAMIAGEAFKGIFGSKRSALLLLTPGKEGLVKVQPVPGHGGSPSLPFHFPADSPFLTTLTLKHQPLLQYDVDTDPLFRAMSDTERGWFQALNMDVYLGVRDGARLSAIFAVGPKASGDPYLTEELNILSTLADQSSVALKNSRLFTDLKALNDDMSALNRDLKESNETLARMDQVKTDFITIASHELRTPLTQLRGYADLLGTMVRQNMLSPEAIANIVDSIKRASDRLNAVYGQMLDASQLDVNALDLKLVETTLDAILRLAVEPYAGPMRERKQTLTAQGVRSLPPIRGDFQRLVQAFGQILANAIKFTPDGGRIDLAARLLTPDAGQSPSVEVVIADSGIGIDSKFHEIIFQKFFRIGSTSVHSTGATKFMGAGPGLGLPIAKGIIERHGGRVWVESPGQDVKNCPGSRFHVILPVSPPAFTPAETAALMGAGGKE